MYIYIYKCMNIYIYTYMCICVYIYICIYINGLVERDWWSKSGGNLAVSVRERQWTVEC